jgi:hypothetical protein
MNSYTNIKIDYISIMKKEQEILIIVNEFVEQAESPGRIARLVLNSFIEDQIKNKGLPPTTDELQDIQSLVNFLFELEEFK